MKKLSSILIICALLVWGCQKPFNPKIVATNVNYLVVEGLINTGADSTFIMLSRTVFVDNKTAANPESKAVVTVESSSNVVYTIPETVVKGTYAVPPLNLDNTKQYRIRIKTSNGKTYLSDFTQAKVTQPIDSIGFTLAGKGMIVYVNTHDPSNSTRYYKWDFQETWQFHAKYASDYISNGMAVVPRTAAQQIYNCFGTDHSTSTNVTSTVALSQDVVYQFPVTSINSTSEKVETKYSMLLTQSAITQDAYEFWAGLKKNTEDLGSIFDAQPSQLIGNIHNIVDATEPVIGYMSAGTLQRKRVFISRSQLPNNWVTTYPYQCSLDSAFFSNPTTKGANDVANLLLPTNSPYIITDPFFTIFMATGPASPTPIGYLYTSQECGDCTIRGSKTTPSYWK